MIDREGEELATVLLHRLQYLLAGYIIFEQPAFLLWYSKSRHSKKNRYYHWYYHFGSFNFHTIVKVLTLVMIEAQELDQRIQYTSIALAEAIVFS